MLCVGGSGVGVRKGDLESVVDRRYFFPYRKGRLAPCGAPQGIQIEKILRKGRVQEARILFLLIAIWMGASIAKVIFDLSDYLNQYIQLILQ